MNRTVAFLGSVTAVAVLGACPFLTHLAIARQGWGMLAYFLIFAQAVLAASLIKQWVSLRYQPVAALILILWIVLLCLAQLTTSLALTAALPHAACYTVLLILFGSSLLPGHTPLITRLALKIHGELTSRIQRYTRLCTYAWCVFFFCQLACSAILIEFFPVRIWSFFVNILNLPLLVAMFAGERIVRLLFVSEAPHERPAQLLGMVDLVRGDIARRFAKAR